MNLRHVLEINSASDSDAGVTSTKETVVRLGENLSLAEQLCFSFLGNGVVPEDRVASNGSANQVLLAVGPESVHSESVHSESVHAESVHADPTNADPTNTEPTNTEPTNTEPTNTEPTNAEPTNAEPIHAEPTQESKPQATVGQAFAAPAFDVLSGSFLQSVVNHISRASGLSIGLLITSKNGSIVQSAQSGWDASDFRTQSRVLAKIAKESVWRKEPRFSSDAFAHVNNASPTANNDLKDPINDSINDAATALGVHPPTEPAPTEPNAEASVCLNELSNIIGSSLCSIPYPLQESSGFAVFLCEATPSNAIGIANYFAYASQLWLSKNSVVSLLKQLDTWLIIRRCSWFAKVVSIVESVRSNSRWWLFPCGLLCGVMFIPIPYYPRRECVFEPETKQYLASPIQGRIASCEVRPGDYVEKGQLMARLDDDQLRRDLATATAEHESAIKKRDSALATRATGNIALADIEMEQAERRIASIQDQLRRLEIRATSAGVVVQGDWQRNVGMPLTMGQSLFEVAELESMTAEVRLLASDLAQINVGDEVSVRSDASGTASFRGKISRIEPRAIVIDDAAVFVADVVIHDPELQLRPGMKAKAQIQAGWRSIGWYLFNRPTQWIANQWIW